MALVASSVDTPPDSTTSSSAEGDVSIMNPSGNESNVFMDSSNTSENTTVEITDFGGESAPTSAPSYSLLTYPLDHGTYGTYMHSGYGKSPEFILRLPRESASVVGHPAILECQIDGHPLPDIMWTKDDDDITDSEDPNYSFELDAIAGLCRLTIEKCRESDQGTYRCIIENCFGACSSTTSLTLRKNVNSPGNVSKYWHSEEDRVGSSQFSMMPQIPPVLQAESSPSMVRELTTISEHLSQEETITTPLSGSTTSNSSPVHDNSSAVTPSGATIGPSIVSDDAYETASTVTNASATPLDISTNEILAEPWLNKEDENKDTGLNKEQFDEDSAGGTIRTVVNFDPPHWRQFVITPAQNKSDEEQLPEKVENTRQPVENEIIEVASTIQNYCAPPSDMLSSSSRGRKFIDVEDPAPLAVAEEPVVTAIDSQLMIHFHLNKLEDYQEENLPVQEESAPVQVEPEPAVQAEPETIQIQAEPVVTVQTEFETPPVEAEVLVESAPIQAESAPVQVESAQIQVETAPIQAESAPAQVESVPAENIDTVVEPLNQLESDIEQRLLEELAKEAVVETSQIVEGGADTEQDDNETLEQNLSPPPAAPPVQNVSTNNGEEVNKIKIATHKTTAPFSLPNYVAIHRTMSSPSTVPSRRRSSIIDYFTDDNPMTRRRTVIMQSLIAIQITFLVFLAVNWQEHLIEPASGTDSTATKAAVVTATGTTKDALTKAAIAKAAAIAYHRQHVPTYFAILTTPLSFVFVLIISTLFTFIFTSSIQL